MGFKAADERAEEVAKAASIPVIPPELQEDMNEAGINVNDNEPSQPLLDWNRDNPDMRVGTVYPSMGDFRLAVRQLAIVNEFELGIEKSDKKRFRVFCKAAGCLWIIRDRTQADGCERVHLLTSVCIC
jgi:hypothetical protein